MPETICECPYQWGNGTCEQELIGPSGTWRCRSDCPKKARAKYSSFEGVWQDPPGS